MVLDVEQAKNISINHGAEEYICWVLYSTDISLHPPQSVATVRAVALPRALTSAAHFSRSVV